jgi:hypothetical protein
LPPVAAGGAGLGAVGGVEPKWLSTSASAILVYWAPLPWTVPQEEKADRAASGVVLFLPVSKSQAGITLQLSVNNIDDRSKKF